MKNACKKIMALLLVVAMIIGVLPSVFAADSLVKPFTDVKTTDWFAEYVKFVYEHEPQLMNGTSPTTFEPEGTCTRAMAAVVLYRLADPVPSSVKPATFTDLTEDWYMKGIGWAQKAGVVNGTTPTTFEPDGLVTREQLVTMIWRYAGEPDASPKNIKAFPDYRDVSDWAVDAFNWAIEEGIIGGSDGLLLPGGDATRAEFAKIISVYVKTLPCEHVWDEGEITKAPTCTEKGEKTLSCTNCDETKVVEVPALGHIDENNDYLCDRCGEKMGEPPVPVSDDFILSTDLKDGAEVVIYNPGHGMAIKNENDNNWYLVPQTITPADNKIVEPDASLVWTIVDNGNGTYSFVNGENKIMCWVSGNYFELTNDANYADANGNWKILPADAATSQFFIQHESFSNSYGPAYIECYYNANKDKTNIAGYSSGNPGLADFGFQFYVKGASAPCTDHVDANNDGKCDNCGTELTPPPPPVGDATFTKVTGDQTDWSGTYVIGYTADGKTLIFNGAADADGNHIETVANGDTVTVSAEYAVVVAKSGSGYTFSAKGGYMDGKMYNGALSNGLAFSAAPAVGNMSWNAEKGIVEMQSAQGSIFRYNNGEIQNAPGTFYSWFRFYKPASTVQTPVEFYKLDDGVTPPPPPVAEGIDIYFTNDVHGAYENYAYAAEIMKDADLKIDAGDNIQGSVAASLTKGQCMVDLIDLIGYDVCVPGNHEFDFGFDRFLEIADIDNEYSPYICANLYDLVNDEYAMYPAAVYEIDGKIVAVIGVTTPETLVKSTPAFFQDEEGNWIYDFCNDNDGTLLYECIQEVVDLCREDPDYPADYVILAGHLGIDEQSEPWTSTSVIANTTGIDAVIDGHSHSTFTETAKNKDGEDVVVAQTGTKLANVGRLIIDKDGKITAELIPVVAGGPKDANVAAKVAEIKAAVDEISNTVIAETEVDLTVNDPDTGKRAVRSAETNLGDLCADAYRDLLGCDIAFVNGGGVRANIAKGDVTYGQIIAVHPFGNMACEIEVTGQQILEALELGAAANPGESGGFLQVSGISFTIDQNVPSPVEKNDKGEFTGLKAGAPNRIKDVKVGGVALDLAATYTLGGHNYMLKQGGDGFTMFKGCTVLKDEIAVDNEVLIRYIRDTLKGVVAADSIYANPKGEGRITIIAKAACEHTLTAAPALAATCTEKGYEAYWFCSKCSAMFSDAEGKNEIATLVMIDALGHIDTNDDGKCDRCDAAMPVAGSNFVLSTTLEDGDQVVIYNPGHGKAIKNETDRDWYLIAEAITPVDGVITEPDASLVWTYNDNLDGTYSFTNGTDMIMCWVSGNYFELTNKADYANANGKWKIIAADEATSQFYIQHESFSNSYGPAYIECYTKTDGDKISGYSSSNPGLADFGFQFYVLGGEPVVVCTHDWEETDRMDATCTAAGSISYECTKCGDTKTEPVAALGHVDADKDGVCDREGCGYVYPAAGEGYVKVTADQEDWSGTYLIVYEYADGTAKVFNGLDASGEYVTLDSITDNTIAFQEGMCAVVVEKMEGGYSVKVGEQYMYDKGASSNGTNFGATPKATTFASNEDGTVTMTCNTCIFRFNTNSGTNNDRFRYYKSTSTSFPLICLYKLG